MIKIINIFNKINREMVAVFFVIGFYRASKHIIALIYNFRGQNDIYVELMSFLATAGFISFLLSIGSVDNFSILSKGKEYIDEAYIKYLKFYVMTLIIGMLGIPFVLLFNEKSSLISLLIIISLAFFINMSNIGLLYYRLLNNIMKYFIIGMLSPLLLIFIGFLSTNIIVIKILILLSFVPSMISVLCFDLDKKVLQLGNQIELLKNMYKLIKNYSWNNLIHSGSYSFLLAFIIYVLKDTFSKDLSATYLYNYQISAFGGMVTTMFAAYISIRLIRSFWNNSNEKILVVKKLKKLGMWGIIISICFNLFVVLLHYILGISEKLNVNILILYILAISLTSYVTMITSTLIGIGGYTGIWLLNLFNIFITVLIILLGSFTKSISIIISGFLIYMIIDVMVTIYCLRNFQRNIEKEIIF